MMPKELTAELKTIKRLFKEDRIVELRHKSNQLIEESILGLDRARGELSLLAYSLQKILSKPHILNNKNWPAAKNRILMLLSGAISLLEKRRLRDFRKRLNSTSREVSLVDRKMGRFVLNTSEKARIKQASRAYALGLSLGQAAALTGADKRKLSSYIGSTKIHDESGFGEGIEGRLSRLRGLLG